jgi:hypothetical protein
MFGDADTPLTLAASAMLAVRKPINPPSEYVALGWHIRVAGGREVVWHGGATNGYRSFVGIEPRRHVGIVVLSNAGAGAVEDIGFRLFGMGDSPSCDDRYTSIKPPDALTGFYQLAPKLVMTISREETNFRTADGPGQAADVSGERTQILLQGDRCANRLSIKRSRAGIGADPASKRTRSFGSQGRFRAVAERPERARRNRDQFGRARGLYGALRPSPTR